MVKDCGKLKKDMNELVFLSKLSHTKPGSLHYDAL